MSETISSGGFSRASAYCRSCPTRRRGRRAGSCTPRRSDGFQTLAQPSPPVSLRAPRSKQYSSPAGSASAGVGWSSSRHRSMKCSWDAERSFSVAAPPFGNELVRLHRPYGLACDRSTPRHSRPRLPRPAGSHYRLQSGGSALQPSSPSGTRPVSRHSLSDLNGIGTAMTPLLPRSIRRPRSWDCVLWWCFEGPWCGVGIGTASGLVSVRRLGSRRWCVPRARDAGSPSSASRPPRAAPTRARCSRATRWAGSRSARCRRGP